MNLFKLISNIVLLLVFVTVSFFVYDFYQEQKAGIEEKDKIIQNLKEELALLSIKDNAFLNEGLNLDEIAEDFNQDYEIRKDILEKSKNIKGVYITKLIANSGSFDSQAQKKLNNIRGLLEETELNAVVIDVKEADGFQVSENLENLVEELQEEGVWVIARMVCFRDNSLVDSNPDFYLKNEEGGFWQDHRGYYWLDPSSAQVQKYLIDLSYEVIDAGFDEIQYDYIRFPADSKGIVYPFFDEIQNSKREAIREFCLRIRNNLRNYKEDIILSVDLFGEVAILSSSLDIGQNVADFVDTFDYISFMIYPSHYFGGFAIEGDIERGLPALYYPYESDDIEEVVSNHPYEVVSRSIYSALDFIEDAYNQLQQPQCVGKNSVLYCSKARIRPWLQDFDLEADSDRGIRYDAEKVREQIDASEESGAYGWLLWNPSNVYTEGALD